MDFASQSTGLGSIANCRELGGYVLPDGRRIKKGLLLRGGSLYKASNEDLDALQKRFHVAVNFDFRTREEIDAAPDRQVMGSRYLWLPAIDPRTENIAGQSLPQEAYYDLGQYLVINSHNPMVQDVARRLYLDMVDNEYTQLQYAVFMQTIVNTPSGAVYWHCSQGKDRTGLGAAFILCALGADRKLILEDYMISWEFYEGITNSLCSKVQTEEERAVIRTFIGVNIDYFTAALDLIDRRWGSLEGYLKGPLCMSDEDFATLRERYTE